MNLSAVKAYKESYASSSSVQTAKKTAVKADSDGTKLDAKSGNNSNSSVITKKEREFFIKLFPENSAQIEKHELFNKNGKITKQSFSKGAIVDWTV
jgi:20S proteasome alpha/beta subunit